MLHSDLYSDIKNSYLDWMDDQDNSGGNVSDNALSTFNRAQNSLARYETWDFLVKDAALTLSGVTANLPSDYGEMIGIYLDTNADGKPDFWYYRDSVEPSNGYKLRMTFAKATGYSGTITFFGTPQNTPYIRYKIFLTPFTGTGTEYSVFPFELLLTEAKYLHIIDSGLIGPDYEAIKNLRKEQLRDFRQEYQYKNCDMRVVQNDDRGYPVYNGGYSMDGDVPPPRDGFDNDYDRVSY